MISFMNNRCNIVVIRKKLPKTNFGKKKSAIFYKIYFQWNYKLKFINYKNAHAARKIISPCLFNQIEINWKWNNNTHSYIRIEFKKKLGFLKYDLLINLLSFTNKLNIAITKLLYLSLSLYIYISIYWIIDEILYGYIKLYFSSME